MKIIIFGGTTEGRELSLKLAAAGADVTVSVASEYGAEEQGQSAGITVAEGPRDEEAIRELIRGASIVVDATHPYAVLVTENIRAAAEKEGIRLLRLLRDAAKLPGDAESPEDTAAIRFAESPEEAADLARQIAGKDGHVLLTTGSKDIGLYAGILDPEQIYPRVLPLTTSIDLCEQAGIPHRNIIAIQGPFSEDLNAAVIRDYKICLMITKESGRAGGFSEKILACRRCGIPAIVISRPAEDGMSFDQVLEECRELLTSSCGSAENC